MTEPAGEGSGRLPKSLWPAGTDGPLSVFPVLGTVGTAERVRKGCSPPKRYNELNLKDYLIEKKLIHVSGES